MTENKVPGAFEKFCFGVKLYFRQFGYLAMVGLPVYLPANVLFANLMYGTDQGGKYILVVLLARSALAAFQAAFITSTLKQLVLKRRVRPAEMLDLGLRYWFLLCATKIVAGIITVFATFAFIIPGILCAVRFAFIDMVVVLEDRGGKDARQRSWDLTRDSAWAILLIYCLFFPVSVAWAIVPVIFDGQFMPSRLDLMVFDFFHNCVTDLASPLLTAILFSFYWHRTKEDREDQQFQDQQPQLSDETPDLFVQTTNDDDNPFRTPFSS